VLLLGRKGIGEGVQIIIQPASVHGSSAVVGLIGVVEVHSIQTLLPHTLRQPLHASEF